MVRLVVAGAGVLWLIWVPSVRSEPREQVMEGFARGPTAAGVTYRPSSVNWLAMDARLRR